MPNCRTANGLLVVLTVAFVVSCGTNPKDARRELNEIGIAYSPDSFVDAAWNGDLVVVELFLASGMAADVRAEIQFNENEFDDDGPGNDDVIRGSSTPLMAAVLKQRADVAVALLRAGAQPDLTFEPYGTTPLAAAVFNADPNLVARLLQHGADPNYHGDGVLAEISILRSAIARNQTKIVELLLRGGADPIIEDRSGRTPMDYAQAIREGREEMMQLIERAIDDAPGGRDFRIARNSDRLIEDLVRLGNDAQAWKQKPAPFGGQSEGPSKQNRSDFTGITFTQLGRETGDDNAYRNENGAYTFSEARGRLTLVGCNSEFGNRVEVTVTGITDRDIVQAETVIGSAKAPCPQ